MIFTSQKLVSFNFPFDTPVDSEYPTVDGQISIHVYLNALRQCLRTFAQKYAKRHNTRPLSYHDFAYFCFHTPYAKMVQKSFFTMLEHDCLEVKDDRHDQSFLQALFLKKDHKQQQTELI